MSIFLYISSPLLTPCSNFLWFNALALLNSVSLFILIWSWGKHIKVWNYTKARAQAATACTRLSNKNVSVHTKTLMKQWNLTVKFPADCRHGLSLRVTMQWSFPVWASCSKACRFPAHGHCVQPLWNWTGHPHWAESPIILTESRRGKGRTKAHVPGYHAG